MISPPPSRAANAEAVIDRALRPRPPLRVLIAGGGRAALEAMFRLQRVAGDHTTITVLAPEEHFVNHALDSLLPFATARSPREPLSALASAGGARLHRGSMHTIDVTAHHVITDAGELVEYDVLLIAVGARRTASPAHTLCFGSDGSEERMHGLIQDVEEGYVRKIAFVMPPGPTWPLALYELALMTAARADGLCQDSEMTLVTPEPAPLAVFGTSASLALSNRLRQAGITVHTGARVAIPQRGRIEIHPGGERLAVQRVVTVPALTGPTLDGLAHDGQGFLPVDEHGRVQGARDVYAAGDVTSGAVKHGSLACRQADSAAEAIAAQAGVALDPTPFVPVLEGVLMTEREAIVMRCPSGDDAVPPEVVHCGEPGWPPPKLACRELAPHLAAAGRSVAAPRNPPVRSEQDQRPARTR